MGRELKSTTLSGREFQVFMMRSLKNAARKREALCFLNNLMFLYVPAFSLYKIAQTVGYACKGFRKRSYEPGSPCSVFSCFIQLYFSILLNK